MKTDKDTNELGKIRAEALRRAAKIAESESSPIAVEMWNRACQRIQKLLEAEAAKVENSCAAEAAAPAASRGPVYEASAAKPETRLHARWAFARRLPALAGFARWKSGTRGH